MFLISSVERVTPRWDFGRRVHALLASQLVLLQRGINSALDSCVRTDRGVSSLCELVSHVLCGRQTAHHGSK